MMEMILHITKRLLSTIGVCLLFSVAVLAQRPVIKSIDKITGAAGEVVSITGNSFGADISKLAVYFGAAKANILTASDQLLEVNVPAGATYGPISVTNITSGFTAYSVEQFLLSFNGTHGFNISNLTTQADFPAESNLYDLCLGDFDGNGKVDIVSANDASNLVSVFNNISTAAVANFSKSSISLGTRSLHVKCGDLNGDGKLDLVLSEGNPATISDQIFIVQNTSSGPGNISFGTPKPIKLTGKKPIRIEIADLDMDGKPEIIFTNSVSPDVGILVNQSSLSAISFLTTPITVAINKPPAAPKPDPINTDGLAICDLDGDKLPEIITSQFQTSNSDLFIVQNKSTSGNVSFNDTATRLTVGGTVKRIRAGDLDGDNKADIAVTQLLGSGISIFLNKGSLTFGTPVALATDSGPWGIDFGDMDGDGKTDVVIASLINTAKSLTLLNNESTPGSLSFVRKTIPTTTTNRHINIGDLNGDGKPDIAFTSVDDATLGPSSKISVMLNKTCMIPKIIPGDPLNICVGVAKKLLSTESGGGTYTWKNTVTSATVGGNNSFLDIPTTAASTDKYTVTISPQAGGISCPTASNEVTVNVTTSTGVAGPPSSPSPSTPVCLGNPLNLSVKDDGYQYKWTGPNNYSGTGATATPAITNFQLINAGRYNLDINAAGGCTALQYSIVVQAIDATDFKIAYTGSEVFCSGTKLLSVTPTPPSATYQWYKNSAAINGETNSTLSVSASGDYYAEVSVPGCTGAKTDVPKIIYASAPVPGFQVPATACKGQDIKFVDASVVDNQTTALYLWNFGDLQTSSDVSPTHQYANAGVVSVKLSISYKGGSCLVETPAPLKQITIQSAPTVAITNPDNKYVLCEGDGLVLQVVGSFNSYLWSTGETTASITVHKEGDYTVAVTAGSCTLNAEHQINSSKAEITISADPLEVNEGETSQLSASGVLNYQWTPAELFDPIANPSSDPFTANPVTIGLEVTTTFTVTGKDENGCSAEASIEVSVKGGLITKKLGPTNFFSPNGDGPNESWTVSNIQNYPQCGVVIYDEKGVKVFSAKPYNNDWNGTFNGQKLPDGVYYYVIRCEGEEGKPKTGSITLLR